MSNRLVLLPLGMEIVVEEINGLNSDKFEQISKFILDEMPVGDSAKIFRKVESDGLLEDFQTDRVSKLTLLLALSELWKNIAYHQLQQQLLVENLEKAGFNAKMTNAISKIWSENELVVCERLQDISFSGRPNVKDVHWTLRTNVASHNCPSLHGVDVILQFDTDQGSRIVELRKSKLVELYIALEEVQKNLDSLLESKR